MSPAARTAVAGVAGVVLGLVDLAWLQLVAHPWSDLGDSGAVWALVAWVLAVRGRAGAATRVLVAVLVLVGAVTAYYVGGVLLLDEATGTSGLLGLGGLLYLAYGVVCGALVGVAAAAWRSAGPTWWRALGLAGVPALLVGEAWLRAGLLDAGPSRDAGALVVPVLLVLAAGAVLVAGRGSHSSSGPVLLATGLVVPLSAACVVTWELAGIGGV